MDIKMIVIFSMDEEEIDYYIKNQIQFGTLSLEFQHVTHIFTKVHLSICIENNLNQYRSLNFHIWQENVVPTSKEV